MRQQCLPCKVPPRTLHIRRISLAKLPCQSGEFLTYLWQLEDTLSSSPTALSVLRVVVHEVFTQPLGGLEDFANSNTTCWSQEATFRPNWAPEEQHVLLLLLFALPVLQCHVSRRIGEALFSTSSACGLAALALRKPRNARTCRKLRAQACTVHRFKRPHQNLRAGSG